MNMSLNLSQRRPRSKRGFNPEVLDGIVFHTLSTYEQTGRVLTRHELVPLVGYSYEGVCKAWRHLVEVGRLPEHINEAGILQKQPHKPTKSTEGHTGDCSPEMADKIFQLIKNDLEARITFFLMRRGILRKDL